MNDLQIFTNEEFGEVRTITMDNDIWFVGKDVAEALGYKDTADAIRNHVDSEDKRQIKVGEIPTLKTSNYGATLINESGLYSLVLSSKLPTAKKFKKWVTGEVLPSIRKTGSYSMMQNMASFSPQMQMMFQQNQIITQMMNAMAEQELALRKVEEISENANNTANKAIERIDTVKEVVTPITEDWSMEIRKRFNRVQEASKVPHQKLWIALYTELERRAKVKLDIRLNNKKKRMTESGANKTTVNKINKLSVVQDDEKLREIFSKIISECEIKYTL